MEPADLERLVAELRSVGRKLPEYEVALQRLGVIVSVNSGTGVLVPSLAGLLTLGAYPQQFFPQLNVTFMVFPSQDRAVVSENGPRFIDNRSLNGPIPLMVADAVDAMTRNMRVSSTIRGWAGRTSTSIRSKRCARRW